MSGQAAVCRSDIKLSNGNVHGVRVVHIKVRRGKSLDPQTARVLKDTFSNAEFAAPEKTVKQVKSVESWWRIVHTVPLRAGVTIDAAKQMIGARLDQFFPDQAPTQGNRRPKHDGREPHRRPSVLRGHPNVARA